MKASAVIARGVFAGKRARKPVPLPLDDGPLPLPTLGDDGRVVYPVVENAVTIDLRVLTSDEEIDARSRARGRAIEKGVADPKEGNDIYDLALMQEVVFRACVDHDVVDKLEPYWDGGIQAVRDLDGDRLLYLYEQQAQWQAACSPRRLNLSAEEFISQVTAYAVEEQDFPFDPSSLAMQRHCLRVLARLHLSSLTPSAPPESVSSFTGESSTGT
jgi:hypothetical protein